MSEKSKIEWTHATFNPWHGCSKVSTGCKNCYAERDAKRFGTAWGDHAERRLFGEKHWNDPVRWNRAAEKAGERRRVFCASMADVFEDRDDLMAERAKLRRLIDATPWLDWLLLTKRPENVGRLWASAWVDSFDGAESPPPLWPKNVWLGTTVENQDQALLRIPLLLKQNAAVSFLSCEPLLGPLNLRGWLGGRKMSAHPKDGGDWVRGVAWVIVGGESGPKSRIFDFDWARAVIDQCADFKVPVFVKQAGEVAIDSGYGLSPLTFKHRKGGDMLEWPEEFQVRQFPVPA